MYYALKLLLYIWKQIRHLQKQEFSVQKQDYSEKHFQIIGNIMPHISFCLLEEEKNCFKKIWDLTCHLHSSLEVAKSSSRKPNPLIELANCRRNKLRSLAKLKSQILKFREKPQYQFNAFKFRCKKKKKASLEEHGEKAIVTATLGRFHVLGYIHVSNFTINMFNNKTI